MSNKPQLVLKITDSTPAWNGRLYSFETTEGCAKTFVSKILHDSFGMDAAFLDFRPHDKCGFFLLFDHAEFSRGEVIHL